MFRGWRQRHLFRRLVKAEVPRGDAALQRVRQEMFELEDSFRLELADFPRGAPVCPRCASSLVLRVANRGWRRGSLFWGCAAYPACTHTANFGEAPSWRSYA
jgi:ssDNA-binding Zn-finger/Zn-ribbon topoisomerase 1